ncbi:hypothetical protein [Bosea sp. (in: a-proteobacteria)]|uniref:rolling circle replication-associated protein n=1 Tax=Bosea sp. (in: a-proteobacteria) TaxID=1871050 RepID=UPI001AC59909|nr:hypothetical protein [Bosea sp. (in: a-proteobacteria)]MBN9437159.1 hypothetical protein [Bosea sp. (in: a-proteobacteria)]
MGELAVTALARILALAETIWLDDPRLNMSVTITLKQCVHFDHGREWLTADEAENAARKMMNRIRKAIARRGAFPFACYLHYGDNKRYHLHIIMMLPEHMPLAEFKQRLETAARKNKWAYDEFHYEELVSDDDRRAMFHYCQLGSRKSGGDRANMLHDAIAPAGKPKKINPAEAGSIGEPKKRSTPLRETRVLVAAATAP